MDTEYVKTSDMPYAAYLMLHGYTYLATVDPEDGTRRYEFYFTHTDPETRENIVFHSSELRDELQGQESDYVKFYKHLRMLRKTTYEERVIRKSEYERKKK